MSKVLNLKRGQRVVIKNFDNKFHPEYDGEDVEYFGHLIGKACVFRGHMDHAHWRDDVYHNYSDDDEDDDRTTDHTYCIEYLDADGEPDCIYLFANNFEVLEMSPPKNDIEWLDRVQLNFKY
jgi:hypothetical protein